MNNQESNSHAEFVESRMRSFSNVWRVADDYRTESGVVVPIMRGKPVYHPTSIHADEDANDYMPMSRPELPVEFAKMAGGADKEILDFVRRYGMPGYHQNWSFYELLGIAGYDGKAKGDPVHWILAHAATVKLVLQLAEAIEDPPRLKIELQKLIVHDGDAGSLCFVVAGHGGAYPSRHQTRFLDYAPRECALQITAHILNDNLQGVVRQLIVEHNRQTEKQDLTPIFSPRNLLDCIYWHLADAVIGANIRTCKNPKCRRFFIPTHRRMKYCPPPMGQAGVSRCMDAAKHRPKLNNKSRKSKSKRR